MQTKKRRSQLRIRDSSRIKRERGGERDKEKEKGREGEKVEQVSDGTLDSFSKIMATGPRLVSKVPLPLLHFK